MRRTQKKRSQKSRAVAYVLALLVLAIFGVLAVAFSSKTGLNLRAGANHRLATDARFVAESGLAFMLDRVKAIRLPGDTTEDMLLDDLCSALGANLNGTTNLAGSTVVQSEEEVLIPKIALDHGVFTASLSSAGANRCRLEVKGVTGEISRRVAIDLVLQVKNSGVFDYGLASRSPISVLGNAVIHGVDDPTEASVVTTTTTGALEVGGNASISGDLFSTGDSSSIVISGSPTVAGETNPMTILANHVHTDVAAPDFPETDTAPLAALATNVVDSNTDISVNGLVLNNVKIAAGTNPTFAKDVVLNGVIYVEAPNRVTFTSKVTINGMIVTVPSEHPIADCQLDFAGQSEAFGVDVLPDTPQFAEVKQQTGSFIVAPGFSVKFSGQFSAINGTIAADQLTFTGQAEGVVNGALIGLAEHPAQVNGNVEIYVDRAKVNRNPSGFVKVLSLVPEAISYTELVGE